MKPLGIGIFVALNLALMGAVHGQTDRFDTLAKLPFEQNRPTNETTRTLQEELIFQRATQTYLWAMPLLNTMGMRDGFAQSYQPTYNTMAIWEKRLDAKTRITLIRDDYDPKYTGDNWHGMPVTRVQVMSNKATFTIKRPTDAAPGGPLVSAWQESLKAAKDLQEGKEVGSIGLYAPDIVIKGNMIDSISGFGHLYPKAK